MTLIYLGAQMPKIPSKATKRIHSVLKKFQNVITQAQARDINESDTVTIIVDSLHHIFGFDKFSEITSEYAIRNSFCDLVVKVDEKIIFLLEAKSINTELKEKHIKQAVDYGANQGIEWVVLTNSIVWKVFKIGFTKPLTFQEITNFNLLEVNLKNDDSIDSVGILSRESFATSQLEKLHSRNRTLNRYTIGAILMSDDLISKIKKSLRQIEPDTRFHEEDIKRIIASEVIRREILEDDEGKSAERMIKRSQRRAQKDDSDNQIENPSMDVSDSDGI